MSKLDFQYKILFLGDSSVGKTSLITKYTDNKFDGDSLATLGIDVKYKYVTLEEKKIRLDIWNSAGQERFKNITKNYFRGANGIIFVCDIANKDTFNTLKNWLNEVKNDVSVETEMIIVGNKIDLNEKRQVNFDLLESLEKRIILKYLKLLQKLGRELKKYFHI